MLMKHLDAFSWSWALMLLFLNPASASFLHFKVAEQMLCCCHMREYLLFTSS